MLKLYNTLKRKKEKFTPLKDRTVTMYACGPTAYDNAHIGNLRTYLFEDILRRVLESNSYSVNHVMNVTDVDDKTIKKSDGDKERLKVITREIEKAFFIDLSLLNILPPKTITRPTEYIEKIVRFIEELIKKGFAYKADDGSTYFSISKFADYGKLSGLENREVKNGACVNQDEYDKENPADFALWKAWEEADGDVFWQTSLGKGRPGWHIECSAMAEDTLGRTIDIHAGAVDLIFPHHENEIAQSEAKNSCQFVRFWIHGEHLLVNNEKMSKKLGNLYTLKDLEEKDFSPLDFRYLILGAHYRSKLNFTWKGMESAKNSRERLVRLISDLPKENGNINKNYLDQFNKEIDDDLNAPRTLAVMWQILRDEKVLPEDKFATVIKFDTILGLNLDQTSGEEAPKEVIDLAEKRKKFKIEKNYIKADQIRGEIEKEGWTIEDIKDNEYKLTKK